MNDTKPVTEKPKAKVDSTLSKGLQILEALAAADTSKGVTELSRELGLTKSNTFRLLQTLSTLGYVKNTSNKQYQATLKAWQVGRAVVENLNLRELAAPEMQILAQETHETIYLAVPENLSIIYIDKIESVKPIRSWNPIGGSAPIHCVGTGKAILAANYMTLRNSLAGNLCAFTDKTITNLKRMDEDVARTRQRGFAFDEGEFRERVLSFGAAICLPQGEAIAALGVSAPEVNVLEGDIVRIGKALCLAAKAVSAKLRQF